MSDAKEKLKKALEEIAEELRKMTPEEFRKALDETPSIFDPRDFDYLTEKKKGECQCWHCRAHRKY